MRFRVGVWGLESVEILSMPSPSPRPLFSGLGFRISGFGFRVSDFGFRVSGFGSRIEVQGTGFEVEISEFRVRGLVLAFAPSALLSHKPP